MEMKLKLGRGMEMEREVEMEYVVSKNQLMYSRKRNCAASANSSTHVTVSNYTCDFFSILT
jgi:hypothetical protein